MRTAIIFNGIVKAVVEGTVDPAVHTGAQLVDVTELFVGPDFTYNGSTFLAPVIVVQRNITRAAFFKLFTDDELEDLEFLSLDDTAATNAVRRQKARLRRILRIFETMEIIDLNDARVQTWVNLMETRGLIAVGRAAIILSS